MSIDVYFADRTLTVSINGTTCNFTAYTNGPNGSDASDTISALKQAVKRL